jgi:hypothetical protein
MRSSPPRQPAPSEATASAGASGVGARSEPQASGVNSSAGVQQPDRAAGPIPPEALLDRLRAALGESDRALAAALESATLLERSDKLLRLGVADAFSARRLERRVPDLEAACARLLGRPLRVAIAGPASPTVEAAQEAAGEESSRRRKREALDHPAVNAALEILGGEVVEIKPGGGQ